MPGQGREGVSRDILSLIGSARHGGGAKANTGGCDAMRPRQVLRMGREERRYMAEREETKDGQG